MADKDGDCDEIADCEVCNEDYNDDNNQCNGGLDDIWSPSICWLSNRDLGIGIDDDM